MALLKVRPIIPEAIFLGFKSPKSNRNFLKDFCPNLKNDSNQKRDKGTFFY